jgi:hypothetical protein
MSGDASGRPRRVLTVLPEHLAVCRLPAAAPVPLWALGGEFHSLTRTEQELSVVCPEGMVPLEAQAERGWRALRLEGPIDFDETGVLAGLVAPLAAAGIPVFALSTYDTDYLLVKQRDFARAMKVLGALFSVRS